MAMVWAGVVGFIVGFLMIVANTHLNDTDDRESGRRSGLEIVTDHGTGCQYLRDPSYLTLAPRMQADGTQICERKQ